MLSLSSLHSVIFQNKTFDSLGFCCCSLTATHVMAFWFIRQRPLKAATSATRRQDSPTSENTCLDSHAQHTTWGCRFSNLISLKSNQRWFPRQLGNQLKSNPPKTQVWVFLHRVKAAVISSEAHFGWLESMTPGERRPSHSQPALPINNPRNPLLVSPAPTSLAATATSQWLEFNQLSSQTERWPEARVAEWGFCETGAWSDF